MGLDQSNDKETKTEQPKVEKKIEIDPKLVRPAEPQIRRCGVDDLKIKPVLISPQKIPNKEEKNDKSNN